MRLILVALCLLDSNLVLSLCPHQTPGLKRWSHSSTWPGNKKPGPNANVKITNAVLLDESPPHLSSITIEPSGRLVWSPEADYKVTTQYILVKGRMDIGSEACKYSRKTQITLTGIRGKYAITVNGHYFGEKFIGVAPGGTLELHGQQKLSWTKLTKTVPKLTSSNGLLYDHLTSPHKDDGSWKDGINAYVFDSRTGHVVTFANYYLGEYDQWHHNTDPPALAKFISDAAVGNVVMLAVKNNLLEPRVNITPVYEAVETLTQGRVTGTGLIRTVKKGDAYAMVIQKGQLNTLDETIDVNYHLESQTATASLTLWNNNLHFSVSSYINNKAQYTNAVNFRVATTNGAYPVLHVVDDVTTWQPGDRVILTSTDYDWGQVEEATVAHCHNCRLNQVKVALDARFSHWGEMIDEVDERGEVALLTRNILIKGQMEHTCPPTNRNCKTFIYDTYGGHLKFVHGFRDVHIEGVELMNMGQQTEKGFYPIHFHMCHDVDSVGGYTNPPWIRHNSIHHSFSRCVTVHGTHGATVQDNVGYDHLGHCFFLEDGGEKRNVFDGNLGVVTRKGTILPSDKSQPATFWMTSPLVYVRNNVAAGGEGTGIWYVFPEQPQGPSFGLGFLKRDEAKHTALLEFNNNVAHSNSQFGLLMDRTINSDDTIGSNNGYDPRENPLDTKSPPKEVLFYRFTGYKNRYENCWARGGLLLFDHASIADSGKGITIAMVRESQTVSNSIFIGETHNLGEPTKRWDGHKYIYMERSRPLEYDLHAPFNGYIFYDGPVHLKNVWFNGFKENVNYSMGAIGFLRKDNYLINPANTVRNIKFGFIDGHASGNRLYDGDATDHDFGNNDGDKTSAFRDLDGSVTGIRGASVVKPGSFQHNRKCYKRDNWNMDICPQKYGMLSISLESTEDKGKSYPFAVRDDDRRIRSNQTWYSSAGFTVVLGGSTSYTIHWRGKVPRKFDIKGNGVEKNQWVRFGVCLPRDVQLNYAMYHPVYKTNTNKYHPWKEVSSIRDLEQDTTGGAVFHDRHTGLMFFKFLNPVERTDNVTSSCPGSCPYVHFDIQSGDMSDGDCTARAYGPYRRSPVSAAHALGSISLAASSRPANWGAGSSRPFETRARPGRQHPNWTHWSACSQTCGGGVQIRTRTCDGSGAVSDCQRPLVEHRPCSTGPCTRSVPIIG